MNTVALGTTDLRVTRLAYGCWRLAGDGTSAAHAVGRRAVLAAFETGYTLYDHADIYGGGQCEAIFGDVLRETPGMRDRIVVATKCGIRMAGDPSSEAPFRYDFSADHIVASCERSLRRLSLERIDLYQLHRPDYLMRPEEVAEAFSRLRSAGKVGMFGVSNFRPSQVAALQRACPMPLVAHQVEISLAQLRAFEDGTLDQCLEHHMTPMAWSPLGAGTLADGGKDLLPWQNGYRTERVKAALSAVAQTVGATASVLALSWLLKHPAGIIPIVGSTQPDRIREAATADDLELSREDWYRLLEAARGERLP